MKNNHGQAMVETLFSTIFLIFLCFAAVQFYMIVITWLRANEAAQSAVRCAIVSKGATINGADGESPEDKAQNAASLIFSVDSIPPSVKLWEKPERNDDLYLGIDQSSSQDGKGAGIKMFSAHIYYKQKLMFSSFFNRLGFFDGAAHCRMIKSPDWKFYDKAYPEDN